MNQSSFATKFEKSLKPRIARELRLYPLGQCFNGDYVTKDGNIIELKLRKITDRKGEGFVASKKQYHKIKGSIGQTTFDNTGNHHLPEFSYMFLPYYCKDLVESVNNVEDYISDMKISNVFITDHRFLPENDRSGKESTFYRILLDAMEKNVAQSKKIELLGSDVSLKLVGYAEYLPTLPPTFRR